MLTAGIMEDCVHILAGEYLRNLACLDGTVLSNDFLRRKGQGLPEWIVRLFIYLFII